MDHSLHLVRSMKMLRGNTRISVLFEPLWGVPFVMFNFFLSLYMKARGLTDSDIGLVISAAALAGFFASFFGGVITDRLGRRNATIIFDVISWPTALMFYFFADNLTMFMLGAVINSAALRVVSVSWNLMVLEDADDAQRVSAFNLINIINTATGVLTPLAGIIADRAGIIPAEKGFLMFAVISMTLMMVLRHIFYKETGVGMARKKDRAGHSLRSEIRRMMFRDEWRLLREDPQARNVLARMVLSNLAIPLGTTMSLYYAPYIRDTLGISTTRLSLMGSLNAVVMLVMFMLVNPRFLNAPKRRITMVGGALQLLSVLLFIAAPHGRFGLVLLATATMAVGSALFRPFMDGDLAGSTPEQSRAQLYAMVHMMTTGGTILLGFAASALAAVSLRLVFGMAAVLFLLCFLTALSGGRKTRQN